MSADHEPPVVTVEALAREGTASLAAAGVEDPVRDAMTLLGHATARPRERLHAHPGEAVPAEAVARFRDLVARRAARVPLQHLTGVQEFWSLPFRVTPEVLIPRPESEHLIEALLRLDLPAGPVIVDLGTGSGCLAVVAAISLPRVRVVATDVSAEALAVARENAVRHAVGERIEFITGDLYAPLEGRGLERGIDILMSNPPYVAAADLPALAPEVRDHEPAQALSPGPDGLAIHRRIAAGAPSWLRRGGRLLVEIGWGQARAARDLYEGAGLHVEDLHHDLAGIPRILQARSV
jgi:release factor glutamine methyltransferase